MSPIRVTVWGENFHETSERDREMMARLYPDGMHGAIAQGLSELLGDRVQVRTATQDQPEHGLTAEVLDDTDVLTWWGHASHASVDDAVVERVYSRELVWTVAPGHPITEGVPQPIVIQEQEMYGEYFDIPQPDEQIFLSAFTGGEVFRSGCTWRRGKGRVFYFSPGDQRYPVYHHRDVKRVLANAVVWAAPSRSVDFVAPAVVNEPAPLAQGRLVAGEASA
jgi:trehalose utilization protein